MQPRSPQFQNELGRIEELINALKDADSSVAAQARELVQSLLELHGTTLERALEIVHQNDGTLVDKLAEDPLVSNLLILHGLHPLDLETRVRNALESVKPRLGLHGGSVEVIGVTPEGGIKLRLEGNCHGCPSSRVTLKSSIEEAIYAAAPDVTELEVEGAVDNFVNAPDGLQPKFTVCPTEGDDEPITRKEP
ncbi:MAG TPA: NifU family protein [Candidatus Udaeobacter sp.]|jgi:Fe-S cluster biogenesis protein NfuA|nr:NifU family protein [Candidatus Udaeobacter sp.]